MPTITSTSSGSGLDVRGLVDQLVAAEAGPVTSRIDRKEVKIQEGLTAFGSFKGALLDFQNSLAPLRKDDAFKSINATSSNEDKFTVSAEDNAVTGSYDIEISQLAQSQKLKSQAFESEFDPVGTGKISIEFGKVNSANNSFDVNSKIPIQHIEISEDNSSLMGIQETINQANIGVRASIINDGSGYRLIISPEKSGVENSLRISVSDDDTNDGDLFGLSLLTYNPVSIDGSGKNLEVAAEAKNALFSIDGISISSALNEVKDTIPGVTLNLKKLTEDSFESFTIAKETSGVKESIQSFVNSYNELMTTVETLTGHDADTGKSGPLSGDASIRGVVSQLRRYLSTSFTGINENLTSLSSIGIDSSRDGSLTLNDFKLDAALTEHADEIAHLFSAAVSTSDPKIQVSSKKIPSVNGVFNITVNQTPESGYFKGNSVINFPSGINEIPEKMRIRVDNVLSGEIKILPQTFQTGKELASALERAINIDDILTRNDAKVSVNYINNVIKISSNSMGMKSSVDIESIDQLLSVKSGLFSGKGVQGKALKANVNGNDLIGEGQKLKLDGSLSGVVLNVSGNNTGSRGELVVTNGIAAILDEAMNNFLSSDGLLDARIDGYNSRIKDIQKQRESLVRKLEVSEERYLKKFSGLDAMLGKMRSTSNFLAEKLSTLPGAAKN